MHHINIDKDIYTDEKCSSIKVIYIWHFIPFIDIKEETYLDKDTTKKSNALFIVNNA
jgi:hypothetical protein